MENDKAAFVSLANKAIDHSVPLERAVELFKAQCSWTEKHLRLRHEMWTPPKSRKEQS